MTDNLPLKLSEHFSLSELCYSETATSKGINNYPSVSLLPNAYWLCENLEKVRSLLGDKPIKINSGFRSKETHLAIYWRNPAKAPKTSAHLSFLAADINPISVSLDVAFDLIQHSDIPYDQLIIETNGSGSKWIHIGFRPKGEVPRREVLRGTGDAGHTKYERMIG